MGIGKEVDELRDRVIGRHALQQLTLANPALGNLVAGHLDPYGVDGVGRHGLYLSNDNALALGDIDGIEGHLGQFVGQRQRGGVDDEVEVLGIVVCGRERDRIYLLLGQVPGIRRALPMVVAGA